MQELDTKIIDILKRTHDIISFRFAASNDIEFKAGQFFQLTITVAGKPESKYFSFSNSPTEKGYIEFTKRITESPFSQALLKLKKGDRVHIKLPLGIFTFGNEKKIAFLSGGIGITPIRSMCKFTCDAKLDRDIILLYSNKRVSDIPFKEDLDSMALRDRNIRIVYTVTDEEKDSAQTWKGLYGRIKSDMIKKVIPDYKDRHFFVCGPPGMVGALDLLLKNELQLGDNQIHKENFAGYEKHGY
ncbi:MAG: FAD-dependent oxidoreductase [Candidatus Omnitrophica bacterium]|nr:FAD-dependent oxidoreductase [Candidatus Omnitrophota bacterium]